MKNGHKSPHTLVRIVGLTAVLFPYNRFLVDLFILLTANNNKELVVTYLCTDLNGNNCQQN